jgi:perosamine synthetase
MPKLQSNSERITARSLPYGRQWIDEDDIQAVTAVLRSDWLTTGPAVDAFENDIAAFTGSRHAVAVSSGTAALHAAMHALKIGRGDEVIVPAMTFAASANCVVYEGGTPVFADVDAGTLLISPADVCRKITPRTKAIVAVDYAGQPCDYEALHEIASSRCIAVVADACHSLGATRRGRPAGSLAEISAFSFHPVKHITTGEGGMATTDDDSLAARLRLFRNHGITTDHRQRAATGSWFYEMAELGYNYRITDFQCALGRSQLRKLPTWLARRRHIADEYAAAFARSSFIEPLRLEADTKHAWHLYVVRLNLDRLRAGRSEIFSGLRDRGLGVNVHYVPVHLHPYYRREFGYGPGLCPVAEQAYERILSLPIYPRMTDQDIAFVIETMEEVCHGYAR